MSHRLSIVLVLCCAALTACTAEPQVRPDALDPVAGLSTRERIAQLFVVGLPVDGDPAETLTLVGQGRIGGVFLAGRSDRGRADTAAVVDEVRAVHRGSPDLIVATDQEGGAVQVLSGPGFDTIPSARRQAASSPNQVRTDATRWAEQLAAAGITMNLAPVADLVPAATADSNPPIGAFGRHYGSDPDTIVTYAEAFADGMADAGVAPVIKHFPGLGRVDANTDTATDVVDTTIDAASPDVEVFSRLVEDGVDVVMMSSATYTRIDPRYPAVFSPRIVTGLLRDRLGFDGLILSDDLSAATQVRSVEPEQRALRSIGAGVDLVLVSAAPGLAPRMLDAVERRAADDPAFAAKVDVAARRVLAWKAEQGQS